MKMLIFSVSLKKFINILELFAFAKLEDKHIIKLL